MESPSHEISLSAMDLISICNVLNKLEKDTIRDTGSHYVSGGYATAEIFNFDENIVDVVLKWGVKSDVTDTCNTEIYTIDRKTMTLK